MWRKTSYVSANGNMFQLQIHIHFIWYTVKPAHNTSCDTTIWHIAWRWKMLDSRLIYVKSTRYIGVMGELLGDFCGCTGKRLSYWTESLLCCLDIIKSVVFIDKSIFINNISSHGYRQMSENTIWCWYQDNNKMISESSEVYVWLFQAHFCVINYEISPVLLPPNAFRGV